LLPLTGGKWAVVMRWLAWFIALGALWLVLDDNVATPELITGAVAALIGTLAAAVVHSQHLVEFKPRPRMFRHAWRPLVRLFPDTGLVLVVLFKRLVLRRAPKSGFRAIPFRSGREEGAYDTARRALAKGGGSFTPSSYVVGVEGERDLLLVHQLERRGDARSLDPLELG
jgi:multisubunit Na+/H+ antiporter MnhE subunit